MNWDSGTSSRLRAGLVVLLVLALGTCGPPSNYKTGEGAAGNGDLPAFPWPPPTPSTHDAGSATAAATPTLGALADTLRRALRQADIGEILYFGVPRGFALMTSVEPITDEERPDTLRAGWVGSLLEVIRGAVIGQPGRYRTFVFIATDTVFSLDGPEVDEEGVRELFEGGSVGLPPDVRARPFTPDHRLWLLVYEFRQQVVDEPAELVRDPGASVEEYLTAAGVTRSSW